MEFIDAPKGLTEYGLDKSEAEVRVRITEGESKTREITILVGKEDVDKKQVVVKNAGLGYLFRVDSAFLEDFPKEAKDWKAEVAAGPAVKKSGEKK